jgi:hypothetical protein
VATAGLGRFPKTWTVMRYSIIGRSGFDSSVIYKGQSLNNVLLSGPNLTNSLLGVLLRFRKDQCAITGDIEQMFYRLLGWAF